MNEAMACGRAVIASSQVGGARDLIRAGVNGWLFESGDLNGLADVLHQAAARGRQGLRAMGASGQTLISDWSTEESARCIGEAVASCRTARER